MALTPAQTSRYWREWQAVCRVQGWSSSDSVARYRLHLDNRLPKSMKDFGNRHFDTYLAACEALKNRVDIRDRERERVESSITRMNDAIRLITGKDYASGILLDMHDKADTLDLPLDPWADQAKRGRTRTVTWRDEERKKVIRKGTFEADLENLRDTLHNRLSKLLTRIKHREIDCPPSLSWIRPCGNNPAIDAINAGMIAVPTRYGRTVSYRYVTADEYAAMRKPVAQPVQHSCTADEDLVPF